MGQTCPLYIVVQEDRIGVYWRSRPTCPRGASLINLWTIDSIQNSNSFFLQISKWDMTQINFLLTHNKLLFTPFDSLRRKNML